MDRTTKKRMIDTFEVKGKWFLPESSSDKLDGILRYSPHEIMLDLLGTFYDPFKLNNVLNGNEYPTKLKIHGISEYGEFFTLFDCIPSKIQLNASGFDTATYSVARFYVGTQFIEDENRNCVNNASFSFTNLDAWRNQPIVQNHTSQDYRKTECIIDLDSPKCSQAQISIPSAELVLSEDFMWSLKYPKDFFLQERTEIIVNRFYRIASSTDKLLSPQTTLNYIHHLRRLLALMIGKAMYFSYIDVNLSNITDHSRESSSNQTRCRLFFKQVGDVTSVKHLSPHTPGCMLLNRSDIDDNIDYIFNCWFEDQEKIGECVNAFISDLYLPAYIENQFLNISRGIESYHRFFAEDRSESQTAEPEKPEFLADYEKISSYIESAISEENRNYFFQKIQYKDEMNFRKRLNCLLKLAPSKLITCLWGDLSSSKRGKIVSTIVETRNYYTHRDEKEKYPNMVASSPELIRLIDRISILLQFFCLTQIGVNPEIVTQRLIDAFTRKNL